MRKVGKLGLLDVLIRESSIGHTGDLSIRERNLCANQNGSSILTLYNRAEARWREIGSRTQFTTLNCGSKSNSVFRCCSSYSPWCLTEGGGVVGPYHRNLTNFIPTTVVVPEDSSKLLIPDNVEWYVTKFSRTAVDTFYYLVKVLELQLTESSLFAAHCIWKAKSVHLNLQN